MVNGLRIQSLTLTKWVTCEVCGKDIEVRSGIFAHATLLRHMRAEHK